MERLTVNLSTAASDALARQVQRRERTKTEIVNHSLILTELLYNDFASPEGRLTLIDYNGKEVTIYII